MYLGEFWAHLLLDLSIGSLHYYLLPRRSGGSGVLLHSLLLSRSSLETKDTYTLLSHVYLYLLALILDETHNIRVQPERQTSLQSCLNLAHC